MKNRPLPKLNLKFFDVILGMIIKPRKTLTDITYSVDHSKWVVLMFVALTLERLSNVVFRATTEPPYDPTVIWLEIIVYILGFAVFTYLINHVLASISYFLFKLFKIDVDLDEVRVFLPATYIPGIFISIALMIGFAFTPAGNNGIRNFLVFAPFLTILYGELLLAIAAADISYCSKLKALGSYMIKMPILFGIWYGLNIFTEYTILKIIQANVC